MTHHQRLLALLLFALFAPVSSAQSALDAATVRQLVNDVRIYAQRENVRAARIGDTISGATSLHTGQRSRAEMIFSDTSITRIGANSIFTYAKGRRDVRLKKGTVLLCIPKGRGETRIQTPTVTAAITGTTLMMEYQPGEVVKVIVLEGAVRVYRNAGPANARVVPAGHMIAMAPDAATVPAPVEIDVKRLRDSALLLDTETFAKLPARNRRAISRVIARQKRWVARRDGKDAVDARFDGRGLIGVRPVGPATQVDQLP